MTLVYPLDHPHAGRYEDVNALVGGKAANLGVMARDLGLPVPPGFVITTGACRRVLAGDWPPELDREIRAAMSDVERRVGRRFGEPADPLLVSARSGAPVSMPGMMDTILDIGATSATTDGLAAIGGEAFAADCRLRLGEMFRNVIGDEEPPDEAWPQLRRAIEAVFRSWDSDRARAYRRRERIPDDMGTAVTVQAMVFGNRDARSATGVLFTRNPATGAPSPYGDVLFGAQGEDVVAGTHATEPIAVLDERLPEIASELRAYAARLERYFADLCDIEFTVESGRLWLLQVRVGKRSPQAALRIAVDMAEDPDFPLTRDAAVRRVATLLDPPPGLAVRRGADLVPIAVGLPASPGVATGEIATSAEAAQRAADAGRPVILVRAETSPDDVHGMARSRGVLTSTGGIASHAAVVARGWAIPAVVGAETVRIGPDGIDVAGRVLPAGATISIDGGTGEVFVGTVEVSTEPVPAALTLLAWSRELDIPIGALDAGAEAGLEPAATAGTDARAGDALSGDAAEDATLRGVGVKGFGTVEAVAGATGWAGDVVALALARLVAAGHAVTSAGAYRLTEAGATRWRALVDAERAGIGGEVVAAWLDEFIALDRRVKDAVTAWQVREAEAGAEPVLNDHADPAYDAAALDRIAAVIDASGAWLARIEARASRFGGYRRRLAAAGAAVGSGDFRYIASPRVDSVHGVWFELHEDLILLAGRTRAAEVAAGRA